MFSKISLSMACLVGLASAAFLRGVLLEPTLYDSQTASDKFDYLMGKVRTMLEP